MEKRLFVQLNGNRKVLGVLRGYDVSLSPSAPTVTVIFKHTPPASSHIPSFPLHHHHH